ncbi:MAG TPA: Hsp20/alpha crystallin family protein [Negativicutes bacterium]|nr:Hsp20/alpha crystallin family protein [Negativicutes bacterium]
MSQTNQYYDPVKMSAQLREMLTNGDTSKLPEFIQEVLMQSVANPLTQAILTPLAQSLAAPLSQYFGSPMGSNRRNEAIIVEEPSEASPNSLNPQIFEILGFVVVRTPIPENVNEKDVKVSIASSHITIKGDPSGNDHIIPLPPGTKKEGATAAFKDRILEVKIPREIEAEASDDVNVEYL